MARPLADSNICPAPLPRAGTSSVEAAVSIAAAFALSVVVMRLACPLFGMVTTLLQDCAIALMLTGASMIGSYGIRGMFAVIQRQNARERQDRCRRLEQRLARGRL